MPDAGLLADAAAITGRPRLQLSGAARPYAVRLLALVATYYGAAHLGYALRFSGPVAAIVWLPVGVGIAFLYLGGVSLWPGVLAGDLLVNNYSALPLGSAVGQSLGNVLEVVVATVLLRRLIRGEPPLGSAGSIARMLFALAAGTAVSATLGSLSLRIGGVIDLASVPTVWRTWWLGDSCGALLVVPLAIAWYPPPLRRPAPRAFVEAALPLAAVVALSTLAFASRSSPAYVVFPGLIWAALRGGRRGATLAIATVVSFAIWSSTHDTGPFMLHSMRFTILETQLFIVVTAVSTLFLAAVVSERKLLAEHLAASRARLVEAARIERRRLQRDLHDGAQQRLTALALRVGLAADAAIPADTAAALEGVESELVLAIDELREIAQGLHPSTLTQSGLRAAIRAIAAGSPVPVELVALPPERLDPSAETTAYYVVAEAVANAHKHAGASSIGIGVTASNGALNVEVSDDGRGGASERRGAGLEGLRDRVEAVGGTFAVDSEPERGTRVTAAIPVAQTPTR